MKNLEGRIEITRGSGGLACALRHLAFAVLLGILCLLAPAKSFGQSSNRWLFIFDTSSSMRDRVKGTEAITEDLLSTAMHGNMRSGDSIGIWTYNNRLHAEEAPLQTWTPGSQQSVAQNTLEFLHRHHYESSSSAFSDVLDNMLHVIKISDFITVILVSDANDPVKGTPFDARFDAFYKANASKQKKAHMPVVTVFRGVKGVITTNTLNLAPWPVDIPFIPPPVVVKAVAPKAAPPAPPAPVVPSLVIIGKKAQTMITVPTDLPDHSGEAPPAPVEQKPAPAVTEGPAPAPAPKVEPAASGPSTIPVVSGTLDASTQPTPATPVVEMPKTAAPPTETVSAGASPTNSAPVKVVTPPVAPNTETVAAAPATNLFSARNIAIISVAFTVIVCGLLLLSARTARKASRESLITRSLDREKK